MGTSVESTESHYKTHRVIMTSDQVEKLFRDHACGMLELPTQSENFGLNGKLEFKLELTQLNEGGPPYAVNKWQAKITIVENMLK